MQDAATARLGESLYAFFGRAVVAGARDAWVLEAQRQRRLGRRVLDPRNTVLRGALLSALLWAAVYTATGGTGLAFFIGQGLVAVFVLETVNYVQHYGLVRQDGRRAAPAWNSDAPAGNWLLLNLGRHSDHHGRSDVPHERLCMRAYTPTLPTGLPGMALLAVLPPLWFRVMDSLARHWRGRLSS